MDSATFTPMGNEPDATEPPWTNDELAAEIVAISNERMRAVQHTILRPECISHEVKMVGYFWTRTRRVATWVATACSLTAIVCSHWNYAASAIVGACSAIVGGATPILMLNEFFRGAGSEHQREFRYGNKFYREFEVIPSVRNMRTMVGTLCISVFAHIVGFGMIFAWLSYHKASNFSELLSTSKALYFSVVTFATVGYGDIYPKEDIARVVVSAEILSAWALLTLIITTLVSWVTNIMQRAHDNRVGEKERSMKEIETEMEIAKVGMYSDVDELMAEAISRITARKNDVAR